MAETLGMLCDKLTIVKLKQYHTVDEERLTSLNGQASRLQEEIDGYIADAIKGVIPITKLTFKANKVFKIEGNETKDISGNIGNLFAELAYTNCRLWHEVEKGYDIEKVPASEKDHLIKMLAVLNLERNKCIDAIDAQLMNLIVSK